MTKLNFGGWIESELNKREWIPATLSKVGGIDPGNLSRIMNGERMASPDVCNAIAKAFALPPEEVFRRAGLLPDVYIPEGDESIKELTDYFKRLPPAERKMVMDFVIWRFKNSE